MTARLIDAMPEAEYHAHPALSSTGARQLLPPHCPAKFRYWMDHPKPPTKAMREGTAAHREVLGIGSDIVVCDYDDWRTKAAQAERDELIAAGKLPMLAKEYEPIQAMRAALLADPVASAVFDPERGKAEQSAFWTDDATGVECRARFDFLPHPVKGRRLVICDYKKARSADPGHFARQAADIGYAQQADWYCRAAQALGLDRNPAFVFIAQEPEPPYVVQAIQIKDSDLRIAHNLNDIALRTFAECTRTGVWPGYVPGIATVLLPGWWANAAEDFITEQETAA